MLRLTAWSRRRSGIEGALPFRGGAGDYLNIRLAGTPAGRFAAIMQPLPCYKRLLAEAEGWRVLFAVFFAKSVTAGELEQEGADIRAWQGVRDEFFLSDFVFSESLHSQHGAKALPLLAVRE